jgi:hypothetical protein
MHLNDLQQWFLDLPKKLDKKDTQIATGILKEINDRIEFLMNVGLSYLSLSRPSKSLSGGESQRIRLATQIGSQLQGITYILDEPSIGLHQRDNQRLIVALVPPSPLGFFAPPMYDSIFLYQSGINLDAGCGCSKLSNPDTLVNMIFILSSQILILLLLLVVVLQQKEPN